MRDDDLIDFSLVGLTARPALERGTPPPPASPFRFAPKDAWRYAQMEYEGGSPARLICRAYGLALSTFRTRARTEGWRRADMMEPGEPLEHDPVSLGPPPAPPTDELADLAWRSAAEAIRRGRAYEARAWMRLVAELKLLARNEACDAGMAAKEAAVLAEVDETETPVPDLHPLHSDRGVQDAGIVTPTLDVLSPAHPGEGRDKRIEEDQRAKPVLGSISEPVGDEPQMKPDWQMFKENPNDFSG